MKLNAAFETVRLDGETIAVPITAAAANQAFVLKLNDSAAYLLDLLKNDTTEEKICAAMSRRFHIPPEQAAADAAEMLSGLREGGLLTP